MEFIKCENVVVNAIMLPGGFTKSSYTAESFQDSYNLRLLYVPFKSSFCNSFSYLLAAPTHIPVLLAVNASAKAHGMTLHFHGNACDIGQIAICAQREAQAFRTHYILVEYPGYGISNGYPNEIVIDEVAETVMRFVTDVFGIPANDIILTGRSIGTGPVCRLASKMQLKQQKVRAVLLQSPYSSIRDTTGDLLGVASCFMFNRWENWRYLVGHDAHVITSPVLFIHADGDQIIPMRHSRFMHEKRSACQLTSELYVQKSNEQYIKGHNFFDYEKDVVLPSREFLLKYAPEGGPNKSAKVLSDDFLKPFTTMPEPYRLKHQQVLDFQEKQREKEAKKASLLTASMKNNQVVGIVEDPQPSRFTPSVIAGLLCCPCVFCCEANSACCCLIAQQAVNFLMNEDPIFDYNVMKNIELKLEKDLERQRMADSGKPMPSAQPTGLFSMFARHREIPVEQLLDNRKIEVQNPLVSSNIAADSDSEKSVTDGLRRSHSRAAHQDFVPG
jgi:abhydrolase domain-containing protein 17